MLHSSISKLNAVSSVLTAGHDGKLAKGQLAIVKDKALKGAGLQVVSDFSGMGKKDRIKIQIGEVTTPSKQRTVEVKAASTGWFSIDSILSITSFIPSQTKLEVDHLEVGYDGINDSSALYIPEGKSATMDIYIYGEVASFFFGQSEYLIQKEVYRPIGSTMQEVIREVVKELKEESTPTALGWSSVTDQLSQFLEIGVIDSSNAPLSGTAWTFSSIQVADLGDSNDLATIQAQYPLYTVALTNREGNVSTYTILHPSSVTLANATIVDVNVKNKGCADCPSGYSLIDGGVVYSISLEDNGEGALGVTALEALPGYVASTAERVGNDGGKGVYFVVLSDALTEAEIASFLATDALESTAEFTNLGEVADVCSKTATTSYTWVGGESCKAGIKQFSIVLPDTECGASRLVELQTSYPELTIEEGIQTGQASRTVTITGGSGDASLVINGTTYTTAYTASPTATAAAFVTAHAASILADTGLVVTSSAAVITFAGAAQTFPTIVGVTGGLTETVSVLDMLTTASAGGCKRTYSTYVTTDLVCEGCDDTFLQPFYAKAPENFEGNAWVEAIEVFDENAKMGIFVKGKPFYMTPEVHEEDFVPHIETSLKVKSMTFGAKGSSLLNYDGSIYDPNTEFAPSRKLNFAKDVNNNAEALFGAERMAHKHFTNKDIHTKNLFARTNLSQERILRYNKKYVQFAVKFQDTSLSQGGAGRSNITHEFRMAVEYGKHASLEAILNSLAGKAGLEAVHII